MTKRILSVLVLVTVILAGCANNTTDEEIPTQIAVPTATPTDVATQTAIPTDVPPSTPTDLVIPRTNAANPNEQAYLRVINASTDLGTVDVYIESLAVATNLSYGDFTEREGIVAGQYKLRLLPTGSFLTDEALYEEALTINGEQSLIFVITGTVEAITVTTLSEPNSPLPDDTSRLMMINAMQEADSMVMLVDGTPQTAITPYLQVSEITTYEAGRTNLAFQNAGNTLLESPVELRERQNYTFILIGAISRPDTQKFLILNSEAPGLTDISFINAAPSVGLIDIYFGNTLFIHGADYTEISIPQAILSGTYDISIYPEGADPEAGDPITGTQFIANPDEEIALILVGEPNSLRFITYRNNPQPTYDNRARITFVHALASASTITLNSTDDTLNMRLSYGRLSDTFDIDTDQTIDLTWIEQLDNVQDVALENYADFAPVAGQNYLYIFSGRGYEEPIILSLEVGTLGFAFEDEVPATSAPPSRPTRIRLVNMWEDQQFMARLDGTVIAEGIEYGKATGSLIVDSGEHNIIFYDAETDTEVIEISEDFAIATHYSIVAYNLQSGEGDVLLIDDTNAIITSSSGGIRLIVLEANPDSLFGLGYSESNPNIAQPDFSENYRRSLPLGIEQIIREVGSSEVSETHRIPTGIYNIRIIDNEAVAITYTHTEYTIEPEILYNVFLREDEQTGRTETTIVPYATP